jgi:hypothetical protein
VRCISEIVPERPAGACRRQAAFGSFSDKAKRTRLFQRFLSHLHLHQEQG